MTNKIRNEISKRTGAVFSSMFQSSFAIMLAGCLLASVASARADINIGELVRDAGRTGAEAERVACCEAIIQVLSEKDTPDEKRMLMLRDLVDLGREESVAVISESLASTVPQVREWARRALQHNPAPGAGDALLAAAESAKDDAEWQAALIRALGAREDVERFIPAFSDYISSKSPEVVSAALFALGSTASPEAAKAINKQYAAAGENLRAAAADAAVRCANHLLAAGKLEDAAVAVEQVLERGDPKALRMAALRVFILAKGDKSRALIEREMAGDDATARAITLSYVDQIPGEQGTSLMMSMLPSLQPVDKELLVWRLGERKDPSVKPTLARLVKDEQGEVQAAAVEALGKLGGREDIDIFMSVMDTAPEAVVQSLTQLNGDGVDDALVELLKKESPTRKLLLLEVLTARGASKALPAVISLAQGDSDECRKAAWKALSVLADETTLPLLLAGLEGENARDAVAAIHALCRRSTDPKSCLNTLLPKAKGTPPEVLVPVLGALGILGGKDALEAVVLNLSHSDPKMRTEAIRVLTNWEDAESAPGLLNQAKNDSESTNRILALRGYMNLVSRHVKIGDKRAKMCKEALPAAQRPEEKMLILSVLSHRTSPEGFRLILEMSDDDDVKNEARIAAEKFAKSADLDSVPDDLKEDVQRFKSK